MTPNFRARVENGRGGKTAGSSKQALMQGVARVGSTTWRAESVNSLRAQIYRRATAQADIHCSTIAETNAQRRHLYRFGPRPVGSCVGPS